MSKSTRLFFGGLVLAVAIWTGAAFREYDAKQRVLLLEAKCLQESVKSMKGAQAEPWRKDTLVCDAKTLVQLVDGDSRGIQREIVEAHWVSVGAGNSLKTIALIVALLSVIPWLWYFLLRRVAEVREAIRGKPPAG